MTQISAVSSGKVLNPARELIPATLPDLAYTPEVAREQRISTSEYPA